MPFPSTMLSLLRRRRTVNNITRRVSQSFSNDVRSSSRPFFQEQTVVPWFVDHDYVPKSRAPPPHLRAASRPPQPLPAGIPSHLATLHDALTKSALLEPGGVEIRRFVPHLPDPSFTTSQIPKGRRMRGRTDFGVGIPQPQGAGGLWKWIVLAQVSDFKLVGTEYF